MYQVLSKAKLDPKLPLKHSYILHKALTLTNQLIILGTFWKNGWACLAIMIFFTRSQVMFADEAKTKFSWHVSKDPSETTNGPRVEAKKLKIDNSLNSPNHWVERGQNFFFTPQPEDIGIIFFY